MRDLISLDRNEEILVVKEGFTTNSYGKRPEERSIRKLLEEGLIVIDKPPGPTSHEVSAKVKEILEVKKTGHSGTLDPPAHGVLVVGINNATKVLKYLLTAGKEYVCLFKLHGQVSDEKLNEGIKHFTGKIKQLPPKRSAVKRRIRERNVYYVDLLDREGDYVLIRIGVEAGTYIRKWVHDLGQWLGVGAHMLELRRTKVARFDEALAINLLKLQDLYWLYKHEGNETLKKYIFPVEKGVEHMKKIWILDSAVWPVSNGASLKVPGVSKLHSSIKKGDLVAIMTLKNELVAIAKAQMDAQEIVKSSKGVVATLERVFMSPNVYPRFKK